MPRRYYRRKARYYKRKYRMSKFNLYRKRSAKSQAGQIYRLSKRLNAVSRQANGEIQIEWQNKEFYDVIGWRNSGSATPLKMGVIMLNDLYGGVKYLFQKDLTVYIHAQLDNVSATPATYEYETTDVPPLFESDQITDATNALYLRFIIVRLKSDRKEAPEADEIINSAKAVNGNQDVLDPLLKWQGPLHTGITNQFKVVWDKKVKLDYNHQAYIRKLRFKMNCKLERPNVSEDHAYKNQLYMIVFGYNPSFTVDDDYNKAYVRVASKLAFTKPTSTLVVAPSQPVNQDNQ